MAAQIQAIADTLETAIRQTDAVPARSPGVLRRVAPARVYARAGDWWWRRIGWLPR